VANSLHKSTRYYLFGRALNLALAPLAIILLPGLLGEDGYARYAYWFGLISLYIVFLDLGAATMLRRYLPEFAANNSNAGKFLFYYSYLLKSIPLVILIVGSAFSNDPSTTLILICTAMCGVIALSFADIYYSYQMMGMHSLTIISRKLLRIILIPWFFIYWHYSGILVALLLAELIPVCISARSLAIWKGPTHKLSKPISHYYSMGFIGFFIFLSTTLIGRSPVLSAEWQQLSLAEIARIAIAVDITFFALKEFVAAIPESILPKLIELKTQNKTSEYNTLIGMNYRFTNFFALLIIAVGVPLLPSFLPLLGDSFYLASTEAQILICCVLFSSWNLIQIHILLTHENVKRILIIHIIGISYLLTGLALIHSLDFNIRNLSLLVLSSTMILALCGHLAVRNYRFGTSNFVYFTRLLPACISTSLCLLYWNPTGLIMTFLAGALGITLYLILSFIFSGLTQTDRQHLRKTFMDK